MSGKNMFQLLVTVAMALLVLGGLFSSALMWVGILLLIGAVVGLAFSQRSHPVSKSEAPQASIKKADTSSREDPIRIIESLARLNLEARDNGTNGAVLSLIEQIIDRLRQLIPVLNDEYAGKDLTWSANQLALRYLPEKVVRPFLALSPAQRAEKEAEAVAALKVLGDELNRIAGIVERQQESEFDEAATFIKSRFLSQ